MKKLLPILLAATLLVTCNKKNEEEETDDFYSSSELNDFVRGMSYFDQPNEDTDGKAEKKAIDDPQQNDAGTASCATYEVTIGAGCSEFFLLDPTTDVIYPGAMILGESVSSGAYTPIVAERAPMTLSVSLQTVNNSNSSITVDNPKLSNVRQGISDLLNGLEIGATPAYMSFSRQETHSSLGVSRAIGISYGDPIKALGGSLSFEEGSKQTKIIAKFVQKYYTIDVDYPQNPSDWFTGSFPNKSTFGEKTPTYVSSVTYGRMALITIESDASYSEVVAALNASMSFVPSNVTDNTDLDLGEAPEINVDLSQSEKETFENFNMQILVIGGSGTNAGNLMTVSGIDDFAQKMNQFIQDGAEWSKESPGVMLSYKLRHLSDNSIADVVLADKYTIRECDRTKWIISLVHDEWNCHIDDGPGDEAEVKGKIKAILYKNGTQIDEVTFWSTSGERDVPENGSYSKFDLDRVSWEITDTDENGDVSCAGYVLSIFGNLEEVDAFSNDNMGSPKIEIDLNQLIADKEEKKELKFSELEAIFTLKKQ